MAINGNTIPNSETVASRVGEIYCQNVSPKKYYICTAIHAVEGGTNTYDWLYICDEVDLNDFHLVNVQDLKYVKKYIDKEIEDNTSSLYVDLNGSKVTETAFNAVKIKTSGDPDTAYGEGTEYKTFRKAVLDTVYPVGSIYMSVNDISPASFLGGTWERWGGGRVPVGVAYDESTKIIIDRNTIINDEDYVISESNNNLCLESFLKRINEEHNIESAGIYFQKIGDEYFKLTVYQSAGNLYGLKNDANETILIDDYSSCYKLTTVYESEYAGGKFEHILTEDEMPTHSAANVVPNNTENTDGYVYNSALSYGIKEQSIGNSIPHNNMQPYVTCFMWKRVADPVE